MEEDCVPSTRHVVQDIKIALNDDENKFDLDYDHDHDDINVQHSRQIISILEPQSSLFTENTWNDINELSNDEVTCLLGWGKKIRSCTNV